MRLRLFNSAGHGELENGLSYAGQYVTTKIYYVLKVTEYGRQGRSDMVDALAQLTLCFAYVFSDRKSNQA